MKILNEITTMVDVTALTEPLTTALAVEVQLKDVPDLDENFCSTVYDGVLHKIQKLFGEDNELNEVVFVIKVVREVVRK